MPHLRIAPEQIGSHFWIVSAGKADTIVDPDDLELSEDLLDRIEVWCDAYDAVCDPVTPAATVFASPQDEVVWRAEGQLIAALIREQLGDEWEVETRF
jgi:hypothetical protein